MTDQRKILTAQDVAEIYGLSVRTIWRWADQGKIPAPVTLGSSKRWRREDLMEHIEGLG